MTQRFLGRSDVAVPPLIFGGNVFGWTVDEAMSFRLLDALVEAGYTAIDTADVYSAWVPGHQGGESEAVIGRWLASRKGRDRLTIATKVGMKMGSGGQGLASGWIRQSVEGSLRRLGTDYIDLYYAHRDDPAVPLAETLSTFQELIREGKVRTIGGSNYTAPRFQEALETSERLGLPRYECLQPLYNLMDRAVFEDDLAPLCRKAGVGVAPYFALASGFLTGKYREGTSLEGHARAERVRSYLNDRGWKVLAALDAVAGRVRATPGQVALAWLMAQPVVSAPIASATSPEQLADLLAAARVTLDAGDIEELSAASA
ncbi:MAG: aldo/keto reductase [Telmatospirillum sp.]|nr:aldo/keto reductase [Telmatospirillum sp.]